MGRAPASSLESDGRRRRVIRLFTTSFPESDPVRRAEYEECLRRNLECSAIDQVCMLTEGAEPLPASTKLETRPVGERPRYADYLKWINEIADPDG